MPRDGRALELPFSVHPVAGRPWSLTDRYWSMEAQFLCLGPHKLRGDVPPASVCGIRQRLGLCLSLHPGLAPSLPCCPPNLLLKAVFNKSLALKYVVGQAALR